MHIRRSSEHRVARVPVDDATPSSYIFTSCFYYTDMNVTKIFLSNVSRVGLIQLDLSLTTLAQFYQDRGQFQILPLRLAVTVLLSSWLSVSRAVNLLNDSERMIAVSLVVCFLSLMLLLLLVLVMSSNVVVVIRIYLRSANVFLIKSLITDLLYLNF